MSARDFKYLFGPVPSRRLGMSLGVDLVPHKTCTLNCVYCECGKTNNLTLTRKKYVPVKSIIFELSHFLASRPEFDVITFSGAGEPTLNSGIGTIIHYLKSNFANYKLALITNGTLLYLPKVRKEIMAVDLVLPSLDAASEEIFTKANRPIRKLKIKEIIQGLTDFKKEQPGEMWLEIFIIPGLNNTTAEIARLREAVHQIKPDKVQLNTIDRPGTDAWVKPVHQAEMEQIAIRLDWPTEIIARFKKREVKSKDQLDVESKILATIRRRPCTVEDLASNLGMPVHAVQKYLSFLSDQQQIVSERMERGVFYRERDSG